MIRSCINRIWSGEVPGYLYLVVLAGLVYGLTLYRPVNTPAENFDSKLLEKDPPLGISIPKRYGKPNGKQLFLACISSCLCNKDVVAAILKSADVNFEVRFVIAGSKEKLSDVQMQFAEVEFFYDEDVLSATELNVCFLPRFYLFDSNGRLQWMQKRPNDSFSGIWEELRSRK